MSDLLVAHAQFAYANALRESALTGQRPKMLWISGIVALRAETSEYQTERSEASATVRRRLRAAPAQAVNGVNWP